VANIFWTKHDVHNRARTLTRTRSLLRCPEISWTLVYKGLKLDQRFYPHLVFCSVSSPAHSTHAVSGINVALHGESIWNGIVFVCGSDSTAQTDFNLAMTSPWVALSGNASWIATFSSFYRATACNATHGIAVGILSVRPSVRQTRVLWQN